MTRVSQRNEHGLEVVSIDTSDGTSYFHRDGLGSIVVLARDRIRAALAGREPARIVHAGGGHLVNVVVR